jgi:DNA-directed RNA polymerase specialized sigma24 family protein
VHCNNLAQACKKADNNKEVAALLADLKPLIRSSCREVPTLYKEDAEQVASLAMVRALENFDSSKSKFSTWAYRYMRLAVINFCTKNIPSVEFVSIDDVELPYEQEFTNRADLPYLIKKIPQYQAQRILGFLQGKVFTAQSDRTIRARGVASLRSLYKKEFNKI